MNADLKILYIDDDTSYHASIKELLEGEDCCGYAIHIDCVASFEKGAINSSQYHLVILDLYQGKAMQGGKNIGSDTYKNIKDNFFVPIIFFSGFPSDVVDLRSQVIGVATKGDGGFEELKSEIERLTKHNLPRLKEQVHIFIEEVFKKYFWNTIQEQNNIFTPEYDDFSLGYMLLRNIADSLSRNNIRQLLGDGSIKDDKVHPMEFYIYPTDTTKEFQTGEILRNKENNGVYVVLTPSCDFIVRSDNKRKVDYVLLLKTCLLTDTNDYKKYQQNKSKYSGNLKDLINSGKSDRYFFLPGTPFIENRVIDFQNKEIVTYEQLVADFERIAKLDSPYTQSMAATYSRYYNRIGFPDIDYEYVMSKL